MATVTKPIALDESFKTNESPSRNIADVLAEELARIAGNILPPNASQIAYDNTGSGLNATNVQDAIDEVISSQADVIADTLADLTENKTATITDGVADFETIDGSLVKSLVVEVEPNQSGSGTPSPSNIRPITGWTQEDVEVAGKNRYSVKIGRDNFINNASATHTTDSDTLTITCTSSTNSGVYGKYGDSTIYELIASLDGTFTYSFYIKASTSASVRVGVENAGVSIITATTEWQRIEITGAFPVVGTFIIYNRSGTAVTLEVKDLQFELGSTATTFEPYKGKTYTTAFGQTVYGGTLDVLTGELTIDKAIVDLGTLTWSEGTDATGQYFRTSLSGAKGTNSGSIVADAVCSNYPIVESNHVVEKSLAIGSTTPPNVYVRDTSYTSAPDFKTAMDGVQLVYELATPTTVQLTPQTVKALVGENHIYASTGDVTECMYSMMINGDDLAQILGG